jgi:hypothetical protein
VFHLNIGDTVDTVAVDMAAGDSIVAGGETTADRVVTDQVAADKVVTENVVADGAAPNAVVCPITADGDAADASIAVASSVECVRLGGKAPEALTDAQLDVNAQTDLGTCSCLHHKVACNHGGDG